MGKRQRWRMSKKFHQDILTQVVTFIYIQPNTEYTCNSSGRIFPFLNAKHRDGRWRVHSEGRLTAGNTSAGERTGSTYIHTYTHIWRPRLR